MIKLGMPSIVNTKRFIKSISVPHLEIQWLPSSLTEGYLNKTKCWKLSEIICRVSKGVYM